MVQSFGYPGRAVHVQAANRGIFWYEYGMSESLVKVAEGSMSYIKDLVAQCQGAGIDASMDRCKKKS